MVCVRAYRILRNLHNYYHLAEAVDVPQYLDNVPLQNYEQVCGWYENVPGTPLQAIVVTTHHLYLRGDDKWRSIGYNEIHRIESPPVEQKHVAEEFLIYTKTEEIFLLPIRGGDGRFRDLWEVLRFLQRVVADISGD